MAVHQGGSKGSANPPQTERGRITAKGRLSTAMSRNADLFYSVNFLAAMLALWPPNPKELLMVTLTFI
jgi:hypothetical protein